MVPHSYSIAPLGGRSMDKPMKKMVHHLHHQTMMGLWMLVDGIGLAIIAAATIMEGVHLWKESMSSQWNGNETSLLYWFSGRTLQVTGLIFLIAFAASFQQFPSIEQFGMLLISTGPLLNMVSCYLFSNPADPLRLYNMQWRNTEVVELIGMCILDISLIHMEEIYVLTAELSGFFMLYCAAILQFSYENTTSIPAVAVRLDMVHISECVGLILLSIVAVGQYQIKLGKQQQQQEYSGRDHGSSVAQHGGSIEHRATAVVSPSSVHGIVDLEQGNTCIGSPGRPSKRAHIV